MIQAENNVIIAIICDFCESDEFIPDLDREDENDLSVAWQQAEDHGWQLKMMYHCCPGCCRKGAHITTNRINVLDA